MKVLGLATSPRRGGNTDSLLDVTLAELSAAGHEVRKVRLCEHKVAPCEAHPGCRKGAGCVIQDDLPALADQAQGADAVVFAIPVYYWGVPAQLKAYIDRHVHYYGRRKYAARAIGVIIIAADDGIEETERQMLNFLQTGGHAAMPWDQVMVLRGYAYERTEAMGNPELVERAGDLGRSIAARLAQGARDRS